MSDPLRDQLDGARSLVILRRAQIAAIDRNADAAAAELVALCKEKAEAERQLSRDEATVDLLESAVTDAAKQEPLTKAFHSLTLRARGLNEPARSFNEVARA
jgi:hypothetical protein